MVCPVCGKEYAPSSAFCPGCGRKIGDQGGGAQKTDTFARERKRLGYILIAASILPIFFSYLFHYIFDFNYALSYEISFSAYSTMVTAHSLFSNIFGFTAFCTCLIAGIGFIKNKKGAYRTAKFAVILMIINTVLNIFFYINIIISPVTFIKIFSDNIQLLHESSNIVLENPGVFLPWISESVICGVFAIVLPVLLKRFKAMSVSTKDADHLFAGKGRAVSSLIALFFCFEFYEEIVSMILVVLWNRFRGSNIIFHAARSVNSHIFDYIEIVFFIAAVALAVHLSKVSFKKMLLVGGSTLVTLFTVIYFIFIPGYIEKAYPSSVYIGINEMSMSGFFFRLFLLLAIYIWVLSSSRGYIPLPLQTVFCVAAPLIHIVYEFMRIVCFDLPVYLELGMLVVSLLMIGISLLTPIRMLLKKKKAAQHQRNSYILKNCD